MTNPTLYFEDLKIGDVYTSGTKTLSLEEIIEFAKEFDPQPMHTDVEKAKESFFGQLVGSGWQTLSSTIGMLVDAKPFGETALIGMHVDEVRFIAPLLPDSTLQASMEITGLTPSSKGGRGYVDVFVTTTSNGKAILTQKWKMLIPCKKA